MIRVGLIGYGNMGRSHGQLLLKHEDVKLLAVADAREERRAMAARELGVPKTYAQEAPLPMEFSRQEYWSGLPFSPFPLFGIAKSKTNTA